MPLYFQPWQWLHHKDKKPQHFAKVYIRLSDVDWGLIIETPYNIQRQNIVIARTQSVGLVLTGCLVIFILGIIYANQINRNFRQLIKGIKALSEGRYTRKIRLITKTWTPFEIIYLTAEVNRMATKISTAWSSIQKLNMELVYKNEQDVFITRVTQQLHSSLELDTVCQIAVDSLSQRPEIDGSMLRFYAMTTALWPVARFLIRWKTALTYRKPCRCQIMC